MRIIHCADLHLDSKMTANLDSKKAKERNAYICPECGKNKTAAEVDWK